MKKFKGNKIVILLFAAVIIALAVFAILKSRSSDNKKTEIVSKTTTEAVEISDDIVIKDNPTEKVENTEKMSKKVIKPEEPTTKKKSTGNKAQKVNTEKPAAPVTRGNPAGISQGKNYEIIDNGNDDVNEYSCGTKGHHCDSKETHDFIVSLEKKGCPYCGSHSCKSFYTYDEWGNACYDPTKCDKYSEKNDPCEYCQVCGKKVGTGSGDTCVRFTVDTKCPECGKNVKAKTCHSH